MNRTKLKNYAPKARRDFIQAMTDRAAFYGLTATKIDPFMEVHGYLEHGYRVLSHPEGKPTPEILEHAENVELPDLKPETVIDLKVAGNKEAELYRLILTAQCNILHAAMPFLFENL